MANGDYYQKEEQITIAVEVTVCVRRGVAVEDKEGHDKFHDELAKVSHYAFSYIYHHAEGDL